MGDTYQPVWPKTLDAHAQEAAARVWSVRGGGDQER